MSSPSSAPSVLLMSARAEELAPRVRARFPELAVHAASDPETIESLLAEVQPQVAMSARSPGLPGHLHRAAVLAPCVRWVQVAGAGFDHLLPLERDDLLLTNSAGVLSEFMAETVLGAMLMLNYGLTGYVAHQREHTWRRLPWTGLRGKTALVLGLGSIGRAVARHCRYLGMHVLGLRRRPGDVPEVDELLPADRLHEALSRCDVLLVHVPLTAATRGLLGDAELDALPPGALLVNTSRGGVVSESALLRVLTSGRVRGAFVDVFETEPLPQDDPLWDAPNLFISPHVADAVDDYEDRYADFFADNLQRWLEGEPVHNIVDPAAGY